MIIPSNTTYNFSKACLTKLFLKAALAVEAKGRDMNTNYHGNWISPLADIHQNFQTSRNLKKKSAEKKGDHIKVISLET